MDKIRGISLTGVNKDNKVGGVWWALDKTPTVIEVLDITNWLLRTMLKDGFRFSLRYKFLNTVPTTGFDLQEIK